MVRPVIRSGLEPHVPLTCCGHYVQNLRKAGQELNYSHRRALPRSFRLPPLRPDVSSGASRGVSGLNRSMNLVFHNQGEESWGAFKAQDQLKRALVFPAYRGPPTFYRVSGSFSKQADGEKKNYTRHTFLVKLVATARQGIRSQGRGPDGNTEKKRIALKCLGFFQCPPKRNQKLRSSSGGILDI